MRTEPRANPKPKIWDRRIIRRFLWRYLTLPMGPWPGAKVQTRWFEWARIHQQFIRTSLPSWAGPWAQWLDINWADWKDSKNIGEDNK